MLVPNVQKTMQGNPARADSDSRMLRTVLFSIILVLGPADLLAQEQDKTPSKELTQYVRDAQKAGLKDDQIQQNAVKSGWPEGLVKEVMDSVRGTIKASPGTVDLPVATTPETAPEDCGDGAGRCSAGTGKVRAEERKRRGTGAGEHRKACSAEPRRFR